MKKILLLVWLFLAAVAVHAFRLASDTGLTPLMEACRDGNLEQVDSLIRQDANVNAVSQFYQRNALMYAVQSKKQAVEITTLLLQRGADPNQIDRWGNTALLLALPSPYDQYDLPTVKKILALLLQSGANVKAANDEGRTPCGAAATIADTATIQMLLDHGADLQHLDRNGKNLLYYALENRHRQTEIVGFLLQHGADPNQPDILSRINNSPTAKLLLRAGLQGKNNQRKINYCLSNHEIVKNATILDGWAQWADPEVMAMILKQGYVITENTLALAVTNKTSPTTLDFLLEQYPDQLSPEQQLQYYAAAGRTEPVKQILRQTSLSPQQVSRSLYRLCRELTPSVEIAAALLQKSADPNWTDDDGNTALLLQMRDARSPEIVQLLLKHGADPQSARSHYAAASPEMQKMLKQASITQGQLQL